jgi:hypothetical protein
MGSALHADNYVPVGFVNIIARIELNITLTTSRKRCRNWRVYLDLPTKTLITGFRITSYPVPLEARCAIAT